MTSVLHYNTLKNMRNIVTISMPAGVKKAIDRNVKEYNYASTSEFIRDSIRAWEDERLIRELRESQKDVVKGKFKLLRSLKDLR